MLISKMNLALQEISSLTFNQGADAIPSLSSFCSISKLDCWVNALSVMTEKRSFSYELLLSTDSISCEWVSEYIIDRYYGNYCLDFYSF